MKFKILNFKYDSITKSKTKNQKWKFDHEYDQIARQIKNQIRDLVKQQQIISVMIIEQFLNLASKMMENDKNDFINVFAKAYSTKNKIYKLNEKNVVDCKISINEIIQALQFLQLYEK